MGKKIFLMDVSICNGCHNCQIACKDEHCDQSWMPYAAAQPDTGQFWCKVEETVHGTAPKVNITYKLEIGAQNDALAEYAPEAVTIREDGVIYINPEKAKGRKDIADKFEGVFWNEKLQIPQGCTGCAHLLDDGWTVPRCVDACAMGALRFMDAEEAVDDLATAERQSEGSHVYYLNLPKRWVAGQLVDKIMKEVIVGADVELIKNEKVVATTKTDDFGDFWFRQVEADSYLVRASAKGFSSNNLHADATSKDCNLGAIALLSA